MTPREQVRARVLPSAAPACAWPDEWHPALLDAAEQFDATLGEGNWVWTFIAPTWGTPRLTALFDADLFPTDRERAVATLHSARDRVFTLGDPDGKSTW